MLIGAPMVASDLRQMMHMAQGIDSPIAIRYPRGSSIDRDDLPAVELGKAACLQQGSDVAVLSIGAIGNTVTAALAAMRPEERERFAHYDMRWLKPIDREVLDTVSKQYTTIITVEDGVIQGGLGSAVAEYMGENGKRRVIRLGVDDQFVEHGSTKELYQSLKLDKEGICESLLQALEQ
jgi:1-deoxy-D-xylulose-5-phosphate synthase